MRYKSSILSAFLAVCTLLALGIGAPYATEQWIADNASERVSSIVGTLVPMLVRGIGYIAAALLAAHALTSLIRERLRE